MIGEEPEFYQGEHLKDVDGWEYLSGDATEEEKKEYEEFFNDPYSLMEYRDMYPKMKHPYRLWNGRIIDREA